MCVCVCEVYVDKYSYIEHRIFFLLVLEELASKCREAMMAHDQDLTARGGWLPLRPPPMSSVQDAVVQEEEILEEASARQQAVVSDWAPSLRKRE